MLQGQTLTAVQCDAIEEAFYKAANKFRNQQSQPNGRLEREINEAEKLLIGFRNTLMEVEESYHFS